MRKEIDNWKNSKKFAELQNLLKERKQLLIELKFEIMNKEEELTREELIEVIDSIIMANEIACEVDFNYNYFSIISTTEDIQIEYISKMADWFYYLKKYLALEEFELCAGIRDVIEIECKEFYELCKNHRNESKEFLNSIVALPSKMYQKI